MESEFLTKPLAGNRHPRPNRRGTRPVFSSRADRMQRRQDLHDEETNSALLCACVCAPRRRRYLSPAGHSRSRRGHARSGGAGREPVTHRRRAQLPPTGRRRRGRAGADWPGRAGGGGAGGGGTVRTAGTLPRSASRGRWERAAPRGPGVAGLGPSPG